MMREEVVKAIDTFVNHKSAINYEKRIHKVLTPQGRYTPDEVYEIVGNLACTTTKEARIQIITDLREGKTGWNCSTYNKNRETQNKVLNPLPIMEDSSFRCRKPKCKSTKCYVESHQTRSGDEGMTNFVICAQCSSRYKLN